MEADPKLRAETARRRTFAIISHPDAGKTTLTEKLLLHGGAIHLAGAVKARGAQRHVTSDWMELERQRGISVTSSVLQFEHQGHRINLLDTPGHQDFSEDTYRTLAAADAAVMLIDSAKGVEAQTRKLFQVCRRRGIPIFTFVNKMDRLGREPFDNLHEVEEVLGIRTCPITWPIGQGPDFKGVFTLFTAGWQRRKNPPEQIRDDVELLEHAGDPFDREKILKGELSPAFFGSAMTEVGVDEFLESFVRLAPPPGPRSRTDGEKVMPEEPRFSGFVFKIQANMDPAHRDRLAFLRVCSGHFTRGMDARLPREEKPIRLSMPHQLFGADRHVIEEAWPGDVIGLFDTGMLRIGDTLAEGQPFEFAELPRFSPEIFARVRAKDALKRKQFEKGLEQLSQEGAIQIFHQRGGGMRDPILGAVGALQFEVLQYRLEHEYGAQLVLERLPYQVARWVTGADFNPDRFEQEVDAQCVEDRDANPIALFKSEWNLNYAMGRHPAWMWSPTAPVVPLSKRR
ncbi:MAG: peptide chain release factor 3 [Myxococcales bacterium]|nr:GTP-binding protein [Myxococcales bacterium]